MQYKFGWRLCEENARPCFADVVNVNKVYTAQTPMGAIPRRRRNGFNEYAIIVLQSVNVAKQIYYCVVRTVTKEKNSYLASKVM